MHDDDLGTTTPAATSRVGPAAAAPTRRPLGAEVPRQLLEQALRDGEAAVAAHAAELLLAAGHDRAWLYGQVLQPLLDDVGHGWAAGTTSVEQEHTVSAAVRRLLDADLPRSSAAARGTVVLVGVPGEQHLLGASMLRDLLQRRGWHVSFPGELPWDEVVAHCRRHGDRVRLVGITLHSAARARSVRSGIGQLRAALPRVPVLLGGLAVRQDADLPSRLGADGGSGDLQEALRLVDHLTNPLSPRERAVLALVAQGASNTDVATELGTSASTVKTQLERVFAKTGTRDRAAAVAAALRAGWID